MPAAFTGRYIGEPRDPLSMRPPPPSNPMLSNAVAQVTGPITDGTVLKRAPNDVGGLLDTSKGWTLSIPGPNDSEGASKLIASQQKKPAEAAAPAAVAEAGSAQVASR